TDCLRRSDLLKIPVLITHGNDDPIVNPQGSIDFYHRVHSADRDLIVYPGLYHEIYNETLDQRERVFKDLRNWVLTHSPERITETEADMATVSSDPQASATIAVSAPD
ncbi:MAG: alpha/beta hydrolase, partial [Leptospiraceae bacterium]|nr:alpha/beta hydrolase [Leptospiraceae bacterium]